MNTNQAPELLTYADLELVFSLSHHAIWSAFVRTGRLTPIRFSNKTVRFRAEDVRRLVDEKAAETLAALSR
jgi:hypothetical protein